MKRLEEMGQSADTITPTQAKATQSAAAEAHEKNVLRGYKAATSSTSVAVGAQRLLIFADPHVSEEAKQHAREVLEAAGIQRKLDTHSEEEHQHRVLAGYKAAIHSKICFRTTQCLLIMCVPDPNVSAAAKQHAREYLADSGVTNLD